MNAKIVHESRGRMRLELALVYNFCFHSSSMKNGSRLDGSRAAFLSQPVRAQA